MHYLMTFERRILEIFLVLFKKRDGWRIRTNRELNKLTAGGIIVRFIKAQTLKWWGHSHRMEEYRIVRRILNAVQSNRDQEEAQ
jgi:hypothetical protein